MTKTISTSVGEVTFSCNAATSLLCKMVFDVDIFHFFEDMGGASSDQRILMLEKIAFIMAQQASKPLSETMKCKNEGFIEWLSQFEFSEMVDTIIPDVMDLWVKTNESKATPKNPQGPQ